jgi:ammonia channel protein AmtB
MTLSAVGFNTLMGFGGGVIGAWALTRDPFWMMSGGLAGIISAAAGIDLWYPPLAFVIGFAGGATIKVVNDVVVKVLRLDDAVGAVAVHGWCGLLGLMVVGLFATGYANVGEAPPVSFMGQLVGALVCFGLGFVPGFLVSYCLKVVRLLRVPDEAQIVGLDLAEVPLKAYPEGVNAATGALQPAE